MLAQNLYMFRLNSAVSLDMCWRCVGSNFVRVTINCKRRLPRFIFSLQWPGMTGKVLKRVNCMIQKTVKKNTPHLKKKKGKIRSFRKQKATFLEIGRLTLEVLPKAHFLGSKTLDLNGESVEQDITGCHLN